MQQLSENLQAYDFQLTADEIEIIKDLKVTPDSYWQERKELQWN